MRYNPIYHTAKWTKIRTAVLYRDGYQCRQCKRFGKNTAANTVHHIIPSNMDLFYALDYMISLCDSCHNLMHNRRSNELSELGQEWEAKYKRGQLKKF